MSAFFIARMARRRLEQSLALEPDVAHDFSGYVGDTIGFCHDVLRVPGNVRGTLVPFVPWDNGTDDCQAGILRSLDAGHKRIAVRSGHKTGKSTDIAAIALAFVSTRDGGRVLITAPTDKQVERASWREIKMFFRRAAVRLPGRIYETARTGYKGPNETEIFGFVAKSADAFSGPSGGNMVIIVDEAAGIEPEIMEAIEGAAAGGAIVILVGNPTQTTGPFYDAFHKDRSVWRIHHLDSRDAVAYQLEHGTVPGLATQAWIDLCYAKWGRDDARTEVRVHGNFPSAGASQVIGRRLYLAAVDRYPTRLGIDYTPIAFGLDVARMGDDRSIMIGVQGKVAHPAKVWSKVDSRVLALEARKYALEVQRRHGDPRGRPTIRVDAAGVGAGVLDRLCEYDDVDTVGLMSSERSDDPSEYSNLRAQLAFGVREWLERGGTIPEDEALREDLLALRYKFDRTNRLLIESKDEIKARIGRSPDRGDALANAVYSGRDRAGETFHLRGL